MMRAVRHGADGARRANRTHETNIHTEEHVLYDPLW